MKPKSLLLLLVAGGCGLVASVAVTQHLSGKQPEPVAQGEPVKKVVVVAADQEAGTILKPEMLALVERPAKDLPEGIFSEIEKADGETLRVPVSKGEILLSSKLGGEESLAVLTRNLPKGMRLGLVHVSGSDAPMAGLINPGDFVDVVWKPGRPDIVPGGVKTLMQNAKVLAVGQRVSAAGDSGTAKDGKEGKGTEQNYTLLVTPDQNTRLMAAGNAGSLRLVPRAQGDKSVEEIDLDALDILLGLKAAPQPVVVEAPEALPDPPAPPAPKKHEIEFIIGTQQRREEFDVPQQLPIQR